MAVIGIAVYAVGPGNSDGDSRSVPGAADADTRITEGERASTGREPPVLEANPVSCGGLPVSIQFVIEMNANSCWALSAHGEGCCWDFLGGVDPADPSRGMLVVDLLDAANNTFRLGPGSGRAIIYDVSVRRVCFTTTRGVAGAVDLDPDHRVLVEPGDVDCPPVPHYTPGEAWRIDCEKARIRFPGFETNDCWALAITTNEYGTMAGGATAGVSQLGIEIPGASVEGGRTRSSTDEGARFVVPGGLWRETPGIPTITRVTLSSVCFRTPEGEGYWDLTKGGLVTGSDPARCG